MALFEVKDTTSVVRQENIAETMGQGNSNQQVNVNVDIKLVPDEKIEKNEDKLVKEESKPKAKPKSTKTSAQKSTVVQKEVPVLTPIPVTSVNKNTGNSVGVVDGNYASGDSNSVGGDYSNNISGDKNKVNNNTPVKEDEPTPPEPPVIPEPEPEPEPEKPKITPEDERAGKSWAEKLRAETTSFYADNAKVENVFRNINERNAYSFFKEYTRRAENDTNPKTNGTMQDTFRLSDVFNRISLNDTIPAMQALLDQAKAIGLEGTPEYDDLQLQIDLANEKNDGTWKPNGADPSRAEARKYDIAIKNLLDKMSAIYQ